MSGIKIGIIEFGYHKPGSGSMNVLNDVIDYVCVADRMGFSRMWFTEHHDYFKTSPWSNPEILLPLFLGMTDRIRLGVAGILINYHSPYNTALNFKLMANLFPGRVDLGFANGTPPEYPSKMILQRNFRKRPQNFQRNAAMISNYFFNEEKIGLKHQVTIPPVAGFVPNLFLLGSFFRRTDFAVENRLNYSKSLFHDTASLIDERENVARFREAFYKKHGEFPEVNITVPIICGDSIEDAGRIAVASGHPPAPNTILGCIDRIADQLLRLSEMFAVDEIIIHDRSFDQKIKLDTLTKLKDKFSIN